MKVTHYGNKVEILKFPDHYVALAVTVDDTGVTANTDGRKIVPAGTIVGGGTLTNPSVKVRKAATTSGTSNAEGVLFYDVDVTDGPKPGAMIIHGFINTSKIPTAPTVEEVAALKQITFIK